MFGGFRLLENSHKHCQCFRQAMKAQRIYFISFIKLLFSYKESKLAIYIRRKMRCIYEVRLCRFISVNSHNLEKAYHIAHVIFLLHSAMKTQIHLLNKDNMV